MKKAHLIALVMCSLSASATNDVLAQKRGLILIDRTGSMQLIRANGHTRCADAVEQGSLDVLAFFNQYPGGLMAVWTFADNDPTAVTGYVDQAMALAAVNGLTGGGCGGLTPLAEAICAASNSLASTGAPTKVLYVSSDGGENNSDGPCAGFFDVDGIAPWDSGSWQGHAIASLKGNAVVNVRYWGAGALSSSPVVNMESMGKAAAPSADFDFFQDLAAQTGGAFLFNDDGGPGGGIPTLTEWGLIIFAFLILATISFVYIRKKVGKVSREL